MQQIKIMSHSTFMQMLVNRGNRQHLEHLSPGIYALNNILTMPNNFYDTTKLISEEYEA